LISFCKTLLHLRQGESSQLLTLISSKGKLRAFDLCGNDKKEEVALSRHYALFHGTVNKPPMHGAYIVTFAEHSEYLRR